MDYEGIYTVIGPPGTGKTSFLAKQVQKFVDQGLRPLICSLTNTAANEIAGRDLAGTDKDMVGTLHSMAYRAIGHGRKVVKISQWNQEHSDYTLSSDGEDDLASYNTQKTGDKLHNEYELLRHRCVPRHVWPLRVQAFADRWQTWKDENDYLDFTDMIELALFQQTRPPGEPDVIISDEAQDHSRLEYNLIRHWSQYTKATIIVGDGNQAIFCWRGADPTIFNDPAVPDDHRRVLKQSYRVPRATLAASTTWIKQLSTPYIVEYMSRDYEGSIAHVQGNRNYPQPLINLAEGQLQAGKSVIIIMSCGYMLRPVLMELRSRGIPFANPWRPQHGGWNPLGRRHGIGIAERIQSLLSLREHPWTVADLHNFSQIMTAESIFVRGGKTKLQDRIADETANLGSVWTTVAEYLNMDRILELGQMLRADQITPALEWWLERVQSEKRPGAVFPVNIVERRGLAALLERPRLFVGTIHSFKGSESDCVIICPDLSPQGYQEWVLGGPHRDNIIRAYYVALTRARESVYICEPTSEMCVRINAK